MAIIPQSAWQAAVQSLFDTDVKRYIRANNAYITNPSSSLNLSASYVSLKVVDANNVQQYLLDGTTNPAVQFDSASFYYSVDLIDVSAFPAGQINLVWDLQYSGSDYILSRSVNLDQLPALQFVPNGTFTRQDGNITLGSAKTFSIRIQDALGNPYDGQGSRLVIYDGLRGSLTFYSASLYQSGTGFYSVTNTWNIGDLFPDVNRYNYWFDVFQYGSWFSVYNSQQPLQVRFPSITNIQTAPMSYCTNQDIRDNFVGVNDLLNKFNRKHAEIEIILNQKRIMAADRISRMIQANPKILQHPQLIKDYEMHLVWRSIIVDSMQNTQIENIKDLMREVDTEIFNIKMLLVGPIGSYRLTD